MLLDDLPAALALLALLIVAYRHPPRLVEAGVALLAAPLALTTGLITVRQAASAVGDLLPVVAFLVTVLVVSDVCDRSGLFAAVAGLLRGAGPQALLVRAVLLGAVVTTVLSLDATVVLLTPVVVLAARAAGTSGAPGAFACLRMANSASLLLPVANLTNLLALPSLDLTFAGFAARMAPVVVIVVLVEYVGLRLLFRHDLARPAVATPTAAPPPVPLVPAVVVVVMLAAFAVTSEVGIEPWVVSTAAAVVLAVWATRSGVARGAHVGRSLHAEFALLVLSLGVVVAALAAGDLGDLVADLVPSGTGFWALLAIAALATLLANLLTNLSATLLLVPLVAPLGDVAVLAALVGLNAGAGLTLSGSLANLLWRRTLRAAERPSLTDFHRVSLLLTPVTVAAAVAVLHVT